MSRIGRMPIPVPAGVKVQIDGHKVQVEGPRGALSREIHPAMNLELQDGTLLVRRPSDSNQHRALHGLTRALVANMVTGVHTGFTKTIEITGVGYRAAKQGDKIVFQLGYSHPVELVPPPGIQIGTIETFTPTQANEWLSTRFAVIGNDKELVGAVAAKIRMFREVEPYKGKGIRYKGEIVRRKAGKAAGKGKSAK
ncbi:MAG TPA: 50S ribosomal protein L6 [Chloroflexota bacterium]|nr:50S ribosomal protein L6 [Chloroflexota bacterium]